MGMLPTFVHVHFLPSRVSTPLGIFVSLFSKSLLQNMILCHRILYWKYSLSRRSESACPDLRRTCKRMWTCFKRQTDGQKIRLLHRYGVIVCRAVGTWLTVTCVIALRGSVLVRHSEICSHLKYCIIWWDNHLNSVRLCMSLRKENI
jgi:hypothetical protein